jgi:hypothetical protein
MVAEHQHATAVLGSREENHVSVVMVVQDMEIAANIGLDLHRTRPWIAKEWAVASVRCASATVHGLDIRCKRNHLECSYCLNRH